MPDPHASLTAVQNAAADAVRAYEDQRPASTAPRPKMIWVKASDPSIPVRLLDGITVITENAMEVQASDVFIARRIRDGSLVLSDPVTPKAPQAVPSPPPSQAARLELPDQSAAAQEARTTAFRENSKPKP